MKQDSDMHGAGSWMRSVRPTARSARRHISVRGLTLIETVGVLAILSVAGAMLITLTFDFYNRMARETESRTLKEMAEALRLSVTHELTIPSQTNFASQLARYSGQSVATILTNPLGNPRLLLIDPGVTNSGWDLPFMQSSNALSGAGGGELRGLRMILLSSVTRPLATNLPAAPGGKPTAAVFSNIWVAPRGTLPAGLNWKGDPKDLCVQRIQFLDLFHPVSLNHAESTGPHTNGRIRLPGMSAFAAPPGAPGPRTRWYLQGTTLVLSNAANRATLSEIIQEPVSFTYEKGYWLRGMHGLSTPSGRLSKITGADFERAVARFLAASTKSGGKNPGDAATARNAVNAISNYILWGAQGPSSGNKQKMSQYRTQMRNALLDYTDLPPGQFNKP